MKYVSYHIYLNGAQCSKTIYLFIYLSIYFIYYIYTENSELKIASSYIKHSFSGKYPYHKVPDRKYSWRQQDFKALRNYKYYTIIMKYIRYDNT